MGLVGTQVVSQLEGLAPTSLAESWDNVGLLIEPSGSKEVGEQKHFHCTDSTSGEKNPADQRLDRAGPVRGGGGEGRLGDLLPPPALQTF